MDISKREWWIRIGDDEEGPLSEDAFQDRLRAGEFPLSAEIKSNYMDDWTLLLTVVANDESFRRPSTMPPPEPTSSEE